MNTPNVVIYAGADAEVALPFDSERETVWASQAQIEDLFGIDQSGVSRHIRNVFAGNEVDRESNMQKMHIGSVDRPVTFYSLDVILAVGYRANSGRAIARASDDVDPHCSRHRVSTDRSASRCTRTNCVHSPGFARMRMGRLSQ